MNETKTVCPLLEGMELGRPMSDRDGIRCFPAIKQETDEKYIVKIISVPASQVQLDALLLTGAHKDPAEAMDYFKEVAEGIAAEAEILNTLSKLEGFVPFDGCHVAPMEDGKLGYEVTLRSPYRRSLRRYMQKHPITHLEAVNLGLDLCAALAICRRSGYLYVGLKPSNIFLSREKQYRIGDLGFIKLDSLPYTSLPGKYRTPYVPAEVQDDMKVLNETVDTYAVGMILYQIYNEGVLPAKPLEPKDPFPHPANADYEIGSVIMKAIDPDPASRWSDPMEMGKALISYMQRNSVNNVAIMPPAGILVHSSDPVPAAEASDTPDNTEETEVQVSVLQAPAAEEPVPEEPAAEFLEEPVSQEAEMKETVPEVRLPEQPASPEISEQELQEEDDMDFSIAFSDYHEEENAPPERIPASQVAIQKQRKPRGKGIVSIILVLLILGCIASGAFWVYNRFYVKTIDNLTLSGTQHELTVAVDTDMDTDLLRVVCTDTYGNSVEQRIVDGQAVFTDLLPDSLYRIELTAEGFCRLSGKTAEIFTTDAMPTIISMSAVTGSEDGSVILNFTVDGSDPDQWMLTCTAPGEETIVEYFTGHSVTVKGLALDRVYTLTLGDADGGQILGNNTVDFMATQLVMARNLTISDYEGGVMTVRWDEPEGITVDKWSVRCYNDSGHEEALEIAGTEIAFTGIDGTKAYTVEVTAAGMTQSSRVTISADPLKVTALNVDSSDADQLTVSWDYEGAAPEGGWLLMYTMDDSDQANVVKCATASAVISPRIPSAAYHFTVQTADSTSVFNDRHSYVCPAADVFSFQGLSADKITAHLLMTPEDKNWTIDAVGEKAFTDTFQVGEGISVVLKAGDDFYLPEADLNVMYVIRDSAGNVLFKYISNEIRDWKDLWYAGDYHNGELTIPEVPGEPGDYSVSIYFNNLAVTATNFTIEA